MPRYPRLALHYLAQFIKGLMEYRANMFLEMFSYLVWIATDAALIWFVLLPSGNILGWTLPQVMLIFGLHMAALGLFFAVGVNLFYVPGTYILEGQLDRLLLRPLNPFFQLLMERLSMEDLVTVITGTAIAMWALIQLQVPLTFGVLLLLPLAIVSGSMVFLGMMTATASLSFWLKDRTGLMQIMIMVGDQLATYPLTIYPPVLRLIFTIGLPLGFIAFYPAHWFFDPALVADQAQRLAWLSPIVGLVSLSIGYGVWSWGLRSYESAGS